MKSAGTRPEPAGSPPGRRVGKCQRGVRWVRTGVRTCRAHARKQSDRAAGGRTGAQVPLLAARPLITSPGSGGPITEPYPGRELADVLIYHTVRPRAGKGPVWIRGPLVSLGPARLTIKETGGGVGKSHPFF